MDAGDFALGKTFDVKFTTINSSGAPITLAGSPAIAAYPDNSTTEITAGITLTVDFDSRTGLHNVRVVATGGNGYATATNYSLVLTAGTVDGTSVVGYVVGHFSIEARSALRPATPDRTVVVDAAGLVDANTVKVGPSGSGTLQTAGDIIGDTNDIQTRIPPIERENTAQGGGFLSITLDAGASSTDDAYNGMWIYLTGGTGSGQVQWISDYNGTTKVATVRGNGWLTAPNGTTTFRILRLPYSGVDVEFFKGAVVNLSSGLPRVSADVVTGNVNGNILGSVADIGPNAISAGSIQSNAITAAKIAADAIGASQLATDAVAEIATGLLDLAAGVETGLTLRQALRLVAAAAAGKLSGAATTTIVIRNAVADSKDRITATVDASGNRSAITVDLS